MRNRILISALLALSSAISGLACGRQRVQNSPALSAEFNKYWMNGKAEVSRYALTQARYGNLNKGDMILIMVTEPFKTGKQVKSELNPGVRDETILKAQTMRKFITGIYDYTMTTTSFKPLADDQKSLKINGSSVEWCGQTFFQLNRIEDEYKVQSRSYFESESDDEFRIAGAISEDEIWQRIRLNPDALPKGNVSFMPSLTSARLRHRKLKAESAVATRKVYTGNMVKGHDLTSYVLIYAAGDPDERNVEFIFESKFPHRIVAMTEEYMDGFKNPKRLKTTAILSKQIMLDYWRTHDPEHEVLRKELGL